MRLRPSVFCGALFAAAASVAGVTTIVDAPQRAMKELRDRQTACALPGLRCAPAGVFLHQRTIGPPPEAAFGLPDPSMLISSAWIDLSNGPAQLKIPATGARYFTVQMIDTRDDTFAIANRQSIGSEGGTLNLIGPATKISNDAMRADTDWVWIVARFAVSGETDVPAVHHLQNGLRVSQR